jgi:hypothetical protein
MNTGQHVSVKMKGDNLQTHLQTHNDDDNDCGSSNTNIS